MKGYDPKDPEERRIWKARCFCLSMVKKGQAEADAIRIASNYYHVSPEYVKYYGSEDDSPDPLDDDIWFMLGGHTPIAASEMLDEADFY
jgi:hypothetical protein